jgi:hypothetical protein
MLFSLLRWIPEYDCREKTMDHYIDKTIYNVRGSQTFFLSRFFKDTI